MLITKVDKRYAKSLLDYAREVNQVEEVKGDVDRMLAVIDDSREFRNLLKSPIISTDKKEKVIDAVFEGSLGEIISNYVKIIARKGREGQLEGILRGFIESYRAMKGIEEATVTVAKPLTEAQREEIRKKLASVTNNEIVISEKVDPSMIGGLKIRVADKEYNGSIAAQLEQLKRSFQKNIFVADY